MNVYFAADHAGFPLKNVLLNFVRGELGFEVEDCGAFENDPNDDYPDFISSAAHRLSEDASQGIESRAIVIGASGQGEAIAANRFRGVRCALYYGPAQKSQTDIQGATLDMLSSTREHNNANALSLAARFVSEDEAKNAIKRWLQTPFSGNDRHVRRIQKLDTLGT